MSEAFKLLLSGDAETWAIVLRSLRFSFFSTLLSLLPGLALGVWLSKDDDRFRRVVSAVVGALTAMPTVVIGLFVYGFLSRSGPLGFFGLLYTPSAVVIGQILLSTPIVASLVWSGLSRIDPRFDETVTTLGGRGLARAGALLREGTPVFAGAVVAAFGRVTGEVGVAMMLGGNIRFSTRTMTTAIALDASKGEFERAISLGIALLVIALAVNFTVHILRPRNDK
ncbi:MAG TPA: ABC transporter permease [Rectinemataceae bacterium]|nr:ABC transporter permease [Rectinemataceae bacterium]